MFNVFDLTLQNWDYVVGAVFDRLTRCTVLNGTENNDTFPFQVVRVVS